TRGSTPLSGFKACRDLPAPSPNAIADDALKDLGLVVVKGRDYWDHFAVALRTTDMEASQALIANQSHVDPMDLYLVISRVSHIVVTATFINYPKSIT